MNRNTHLTTRILIHFQFFQIKYLIFLHFQRTQWESLSWRYSIFIFVYILLYRRTSFSLNHLIFFPMVSLSAYSFPCVVVLRSYKNVHVSNLYHGKQNTSGRIITVIPFPLRFKHSFPFRFRFLNFLCLFFLIIIN